MSGTRRRWGSLSASDARAGEGVFLESISGRSSGSGLAGREQGWGVLEMEGNIGLLPWFFKGLVFPGSILLRGAGEWFRGCMAKSSGVPRRQSPPGSRATGLSEQTPQSLSQGRLLCIERMLHAFCLIVCLYFFASACLFFNWKV